MRLARFQCSRTDCHEVYERAVEADQVTEPCPKCGQQNTVMLATTSPVLDGICHACGRAIDDHTGAFAGYCAGGKK